MPDNESIGNSTHKAAFVGAAMHAARRRPDNTRHEPIHRLVNKLAVPHFRPSVAPLVLLIYHAELDQC